MSEQIQARVLCAVEWAGWEDFVGDGGLACCPSCGGYADRRERAEALIGLTSDERRIWQRSPHLFGHRPACELNALLIAVGYETQESRDALRKIARVVTSYSGQVLYGVHPEQPW